MKRIRSPRGVASPVHSASALARGFTLVELLVVTAIISVLAAMILPSLGQAKSATMSTACSSNQRMMGVALAIYLSTEGRYPIGETLDGRGSWQWTLCPTNNDRILYCPRLSEPSEDFKKFFKKSSRIFPHLGYNAIGSVRINPPADPLGFAGRFSWTDAGSGHFEGLREEKVVAPSETIVFGDGGPILYPTGLPENSISPAEAYYIMMPGIVPRYGVPGLDGRHSGKANMLITDGHVESKMRDEWIAAKPDVRRRWNTDNQPHESNW